MRIQMLSVVAAIAMVCAIAACGSSSKSGSPGTTASSTTSIATVPGLSGHTYVSTTVTGHTMPVGTRVTLIFTNDGRLSGTAGCNTIGGTFSVERGRLVVGQLSQTQMACTPPARMAQDEWLAGVLNARPELDLSGTTLRLSTGATTIELAES